MAPSRKQLLLYTCAYLLVCGGLLYLVVGLLVYKWYVSLGGLLFAVAGTAEGWYAGKMGRQTGWRLAAPLIVFAGVVSVVAVLVVMRGSAR